MFSVWNIKCSCSVWVKGRSKSTNSPLRVGLGLACGVEVQRSDCCSWSCGSASNCLRTWAHCLNPLYFSYVKNGGDSVGLIQRFNEITHAKVSEDGAWNVALNVCNSFILCCKLGSWNRQA